MIGLEKVTGRIISEAKAEAERISAAAEDKCRELSEAADEKIAAVNAAVDGEIAAEEVNIMSRAQSSAGMKARNTILSARGDALDRTFDACVLQICGMPEKDYIGFIVSCAKEAVDSAKGTSCRLSFSAADTAKLGQKALEAFKKSYPGTEFSLSGKAAAIKGGVLLDFGDTDVNCAVETVVAEARPALEAEVCRILFDRSSSNY